MATQISTVRHDVYGFVIQFGEGFHAYTLPPVVVKAIALMQRQVSKVEAVKLCRAVTGCSLKAAKDLVEYLEDVQVRQVRNYQEVPPAVAGLPSPREVVTETLKRATQPGEQA